MRTVVSTIGTPTYGISEYIVKISQPTLNKNSIRIKNSKTFVNIAKTWDIDIDEVQVSYDVVNLYPSVPLKKAIEVFISILSNDEELNKHTKLHIAEIKELVELCLSKCYFLWNNEIHQLKNSGPIGLSIMVVIAEGFLQVLEKQALYDALKAQPPIDIKSYYRFVDDSHARFPQVEQAERFMEILNKQDNNIKYTIEIENDMKELDFLDIKNIE